MDELPSDVLMKGSMVEIEKLSCFYELMRQNNIFVNHDTTDEIGNGIIFKANQIRFSLI